MLKKKQLHQITIRNNTCISLGSRLPPEVEQWKIGGGGSVVVYSNIEINYTSRALLWKVVGLHVDRPLQCSYIGCCGRHLVAINLYLYEVNVQKLKCAPWKIIGCTHGHFPSCRRHTDLCIKEQNYDWSDMIFGKKMVSEDVDIFCI